MSTNRLLKPTEYGLGSKFKDYFPGQAEAIESIEAQFQDGRRVVFCDGPVGCGKTAVASSLIWTKQGLRRLFDIKPTTKVLGLGQLNGQVVLEQVLAKKPEGIQPTIHITTALGYSFEGSPDHHLLSIKDGKTVWIKLKDLVPDKHYLALLNTIAPSPPITDLIPGLNDWETGYLLGIYVAEGSAFKNAIQISNQHPAIQSMIEIICFHAGLNYTRSERLINVRSPFMHNFCAEHCGCGSYNKRIPPIIFEGSLELKYGFVAGLFDGDGTVNKRLASYSTVSEELATGLQMLLLAMGILSSRRRKRGKYKGKEHLSWRLNILADSLPNLDKCRFVRINLNELLCKKRNTNLNIIPEVAKPLNRLWKHLSSLINRKACVINGKLRWEKGHPLGSRALFKKHSGMSHKTLWAYRAGRQNPSRRQLCRILNGLLDSLPEIRLLKDYQHLQLLTQAPVFWDRVADISEGAGELIEISVEDSSNYIANGFISHNSLLATVIAKRLHNPDPTALVVVQTKILGRQYSKDFPFYAVMEGRNNHKCALQPELRADEGLCRLETFMCEEKDSICPYFLQKAKAIASNMVVTNASFFLHEANYAGGLVCSQRDFLVLDEGHLLENSLMDFVAVQLPEHSLRLVGLDLPKLDSPEGAKAWAAKIWPVLEKEHNVLERSCAAVGDSVDADSIRRLLRFRRMTARLKTLSAIEPKKWFLAEQHKGYILRPFLIDDFVRPLVTRHAAKTLLMSATFLNPRVMANLLGLDRDTVGWHQMDSNFPPERRPYNFVPIVKLSRRTGPVGYDRLTEAIDQILERHSKEKGIVHTASFKIMNEILKRTKYPQRFISHRPSSTRDTTSGYSRDEAIERFLTTSQPLALISPSMGLGLDLKDDLARWTIIAKINFLNLGDPQIRYRQSLDPEWYAWSAVASTIQSVGRIVRHSLDWGTSYLLDSNLYILLKRYPYLFPKWWKKAFHKVTSIEEAQIAIH